MAISADLSSLPADARPSMQICLFEAARQIGATAGTRLRFDRLAHIEPGNGGWRFRAETTATYLDGDRASRSIAGQRPPPSFSSISRAEPSGMLAPLPRLRCGAAMP
ncbi:hypothetical protein [Sphingomonas cavernae]|uniref:hypothetical protein n=1 Tax=Sphingomonas cavernae TaxID=2320861 RepID=UPI0015FFF40B|nr:hypothetical protein [Sphingomonas cavernae]